MNVISGPTPLESFGRWDPASSCWRTSQASLLTGMEEPWSGSFPRQGMIVSGVAYRLRPWVPRTSVGAGGAWRTPNSAVIEAKSSVKKLTGRTPKDPQVGLADQVAQYPTPSAQAFHSNRGGSDSSDPRGYSRAGKERLSLHGMAKTGLWPTPQGSLEHYGQPRENDRGDVQEAALWRTPRANDWKGGVTGSQGSRRAPVDYFLPDQVNQAQGHGGQLNPRWVEWLQGVPMGWTDLNPLSDEAWRVWQQEPHWEGGEWEGVPRIATGVANRVGQLRALGNGIVPAVLARFLCGGTA